MSIASARHFATPASKAAQTAAQPLRRLATQPSPPPSPKDDALKSYGVAAGIGAVTCAALGYPAHCGVEAEGSHVTSPPRPLHPVAHTALKTARESGIWAGVGPVVMGTLQPLTNFMWVASEKPKAPISEIFRATWDRGPYLDAAKIAKSAVKQFGGMLGVGALVDAVCEHTAGSNLGGVPGALAGASYETYTTGKVQSQNIINSFNKNLAPGQVPKVFAPSSTASLAHVGRNTISMLVLAKSKPLVQPHVSRAFEALDLATTTPTGATTTSLSLTTTVTASFFGSIVSSPFQQLFAATTRDPQKPLRQVLKDANIFSPKAALVRASRTGPVLVAAISLYNLGESLVPQLPFTASGSR